jgi:hypothetical protein
MGDGDGLVPHVSRVLLRVEWADGQVREFEADQPRALEVSIGRREPPPLLAEWFDATGEPARLYQPEHPLVPRAIYGGPAYGVEVSFRANEDSRAHPFTVRVPPPVSTGLPAAGRGNGKGPSRSGTTGNIPYMGDGAAATAAGEAGHEARAGIWPLAARLCALQQARLAAGAVLLLPAGAFPGAGDHYCGWPVLRVGVPEPMIGLPGGNP